MMHPSQLRLRLAQFGPPVRLRLRLEPSCTGGRSYSGHKARIGTSSDATEIGDSRRLACCAPVCLNHCNAVERGAASRGRQVERRPPRPVHTSLGGVLLDLLGSTATDRASPDTTSDNNWRTPGVHVPATCWRRWVIGPVRGTGAVAYATAGRPALGWVARIAPPVADSTGYVRHGWILRATAAVEWSASIKALQLGRGPVQGAEPTAGIAASLRSRKGGAVWLGSSG
jgi:hypothetical protein